MTQNQPLPPEVLLTRPWTETKTPASLDIPKGMVGPRERACYYWLGKNWLSGQGTLIDAGAFLGASTLCFATGAADAGHKDFKGRPLIHAYDYFKVVDQYVGEAISRDFRPIKNGESYLDIFQAQTAAHANLIEPHPGNFLSHKWHGDPVEVLFIDIAKTADLNSHAIAEFFPHLIPGRSVLVHQDYFHCWHPYIHISMEFLADEFEMVDEHVPHQSRVWRLAKPIPAEKIARMAAYDLSREERLALLDRQIAKSSDFYRPMIEVVKLWQHCIDHDWDTAHKAMAAFRKNHDLENTQILWATQARDVENAIARKMG